MDHSRLFQVICLACRKIHKTYPNKYDGNLDLCKILEGKLQEQCSTLGCIQDQDLLGYVKTQVVGPHTLNLTSRLMMLSHLWVVHPHFLLAHIILGSSLSLHIPFHFPDFPTSNSTVGFFVPYPFPSE